MADNPLNINFQIVIEYSNDHIYMTDGQARIIYSNEAVKDMLGYTVDEFIGIKPQDIIHPDDLPKAMRFLDDSHQYPGETQQVELRGRHKSGHYVWYESSATNLLHDPEVKAIVVRNHDITTIKQYQEEFQEAHHKYQHIVEIQTELVCLMTPDCTLKFVNQSYANLFNSTPENIVGSKIFDYIPSVEHDIVKRHIAALTREKPAATSQNHYILPDGTSRWFEWTDRAIFDDKGNIIEYQGVGRDINDRKLLEIERERHTRETESMRQFLQTTLDAFPANTVVLDRNGTIINKNAAWEDLVKEGIPNSENFFMGDNYLTVCNTATNIMPEKIDVATDGIRQVIEGKRDAYHLKYPCRYHHNHWYEMRVTPFPEPAPRRVVVAHLDITELHEAEMALRDSERRFRLIAENAHDIIMQYDADGIIQYLSPAAKILTENPERFVGQHYSTLATYMHPDEVDTVFDIVAKANETLTPIRYEYRQRVHNSEDQYLWLEVFRSYLTEGEELQSIVTITRNITERKEAEHELKSLYKATSQLFQADTLESLSQKIVESVVQEFAHVDCGLMLVDKKENSITRLARHGALNIDTQASLTLDGRGLVPLAIKTGETVYAPDVTQHEHYVANVANTRCELVIPLKTADGVIAVLDLQHAQTNAFTERDQRLLNAYAEKAAVAIELMQLYETVNKYATSLEQRVVHRTHEVQESKEYVEAILNSSSDGIVTLSTQYGIQQANHAFQKLFDSYDESYVNEALENLFHEKDRQQVKQVIDTVIDDNITRRLEVTAQKWDGTHFIAEISFAPLDQTRADDNHIVCILRDITEQKQQEHELRYLASLLDKISDAVITTDMDFNIRRWNKAAERMYGYSADEAIGANVTSLLNTHTNHDTQLDVEKSAQTLFDTGYWNGEVIQSHRNGNDLYVLSSVNLIKNQEGDFTEIIAINHDITERRLAQIALDEKLNQELEFQSYLKALHEITVELAQVDDLNTFYKRVVEFGLERLDFERLAMFLYDKEDNLVIGTYGTDEQGELADESYLRFTPAQDGMMLQALHHHERFAFTEDRTLLTAQRATGQGWNAVGVIWSGRESLGWLTIDNAITHTPTAPHTLDILALYSIAVGTLLKLKQEQKALADSESRYRLLAENANDVVLQSDADSRYIYASPSVKLVMGYEPEELLGKISRDYVHPEDIPISRQASQQAANRDSEKIDVTLRFRHKQGHYIWIEIKGHALWTEDNKLKGYISSSRDVTNRIHAEIALRESEEKYRHLIESMRGGVIMYDEIRRITFVNERIRELLGYTVEEMMGTTADNYIDDASRKTLQEEAMHRRQGKSTTYEVTAFHRNGTAINLLISGSPLYDNDNNYEGSFAVVVDITAQKHAEDTLRAALEREKELNELKTRFVSMASHEFRTPLATILAMTDTLSNYRHKLSDEQVESRYNKIKEQIRYLTDIMEDVLWLARKQARRVGYSPSNINLVELGQNVIEEFKYRPDISHKLIYTCASHLTNVFVDKRLMRQIINNLLTNAIKYSPNNTPVSLAISQKNSDLMIVITDNGIGIPESDRRHLFEPFHRATNVGTISGTGLGLMIVKESVDLHNGTINVDSNLNVGTTVTVKIPLRSSEA